MAIPIIKKWQEYYQNPHEGLGSSYERVVLNNLLERLQKQGDFKTALEAPCFGFTGITGINLVRLSQMGCEVHLEDHSHQRCEYIRNTWADLALPVNVRYNEDYQTLDFADKSIDFGFNFSAMWFVESLPQFIRELCRVVQKQILICVPNQTGIGFKGQLKEYSPEAFPMLHPQHIDKQTIVYLMKKSGWHLIEQAYIDCPPWPDIGMNKEDYFQILSKTPSKEVKQSSSGVSPKTLNILPYYKGEDRNFAKRMMRFYPFEAIVPDCFKRVWAHHYYLLFSS